MINQNLYPDLFKAALCQCPLLKVLYTFELDYCVYTEYYFENMNNTIPALHRHMLYAFKSVFQVIKLSRVQPVTALLRKLIQFHIFT